MSHAKRCMPAVLATTIALTTIAIAQVSPPPLSPQSSPQLSPSMPAPPPSTTPASQPSTKPIDLYERLLGTENDEAEKPLLPLQRTTIDRSTGASAIMPGAPQLPTAPEGTFLVDRVGRLVKSADGIGWEFNFIADGAAMQDPPVKVLPNQKLAVMEDELQAASRDLKFKISGPLTEYRGRNYVMLEKVLVVRDPS